MVSQVAGGPVTATVLHRSYGSCALGKGKLGGLFAFGDARFYNPIRAAIRPRVHELKNRERTNRMLLLMQLHANHQDDENVYVQHIRDCLEVNQGRPSVARRAVVDIGRVASLR